VNCSSKLVSSLLAALLLSSSSVAFADDTEVEVRFKKGVELYREADFRSAAVEFRRAYEKSHNFKILYNIAQSEYQLTNYAAALDAFNRYLKEGGANIDADRRREVEEELPKIRSRVATLTVKTRSAGAHVVVDEQSVGTTPLAEPVLLNPGPHRVVIQQEGYTDAVRNIDVVGGEAPVVELDPVAVPVVMAPPKSWTPAVVAWTATGVFTAGAVVLGLVANSKSNELKDLKDTRGAPAKALSDLDSDVKTFALLTDISIVAAAMSCGVATFLTIDHGASSSKKDHANAPPRTAIRVAPTLGGFRLSGSF
jgi:tetratricopeptide (TPR) repeat protein